MKKLGIAVALFFVLVSCAPKPLRAQSAPSTYPREWATSALLGGTLGFFGFIGGLLVVDKVSDCYEICVDWVIGAMVGEVLGVALGAHIGNRRRGRFLADLGVSAGVGAAGASLAISRGGQGGQEFLIVSALVQVMAVVVTEIVTSPDLVVAPVVQPRSDGLDLGLTARW